MREEEMYGMVTVYLFMMFYLCACENETLITHVDSQTESIVFLARSGNHLPIRFLKRSSVTWGFEGPSELTQFGKRQAFSLGRDLREFIGPILNSNYFADEGKFYTSSENNCQMSLQALLAGLYPPDTFAEWNHALDWTPVPYYINDSLLKSSAFEGCLHYSKVWKPIVDETSNNVRNLIKEEEPILEYIANNTGWPPTLQSASLLFENLKEMELHGVAFDKWINHPSLSGYNRDLLLQKLKTITDMKTKLCSELNACRSLLAGRLLEHILTTLDAIANGTRSEKIVGFICDQDVLLSLMNLVFLKEEQVNETAGFIIELRTDPLKSVRILFHDKLTDDHHIIYQAIYGEELQKIADENSWVSFEDFVDLISNNMDLDWKNCEMKVCVDHGSQSTSKGYKSYTHLYIFPAIIYLYQLIYYYF